MATPLALTQLATSISSVESVPGITDKQINRVDLWKVKQHLRHISTKWHDIGLYLKLPKEKLNEIDADHSDTSRKLTEMIDVWIIRGEGCTWEKLYTTKRNFGLNHPRNTKTTMTTALEANPHLQDFKEERYITKQDFSFRHLENTKTTMTTALEPNPHLQDSKEEWCMKFWEEKEKSRRKIELEYYQMHGKAGKVHLDKLCKCLMVPDSVPESMLKNIKLYHPLIPCTSYCLIQLLEVMGYITEKFQQEQICLEKWADYLVTDTKSISNVLQNLTAKKENLKEVLYIQAVQKPGCHTAGTSQFETQCSKTMATNLKCDMEEIKSYQTTLHHELSRCLNQVDSTIKRNGSMKLTMNCIKTTTKGVPYFTVHINFCILFLILLQIFQIKSSVATISIIGTILLAIVYHGFPSVGLIMNKGLHKIPALGTSGGLVLCSLAGAVGSTMTSAELRSVPISSLHFNSDNITYTKLVMLYYTTIINNADPHLRGMLVILLVSLPIVVLKDLVYHTKGYDGAFAFILFMILLPSVESFEIISALCGLLLGIMGNFYSILYGIMYGYGGYLYSVAWTTGTMISEYICGVIFQQPELTSWLPPIGGALGTACLLQLNTYIQYKFIASMSPISQSTQILEENEHKLNIIRDRIKKTSSIHSTHHFEIMCN